MAIVIESVAYSAVDTSAPLVITAPTGIAVGDLLFAFVTSLSNAYTSITPPAGWTSYGGVSCGGTESHRAFWKVADSGDTGAANFSFAIGDSEISAGGILRISGADATTITNSSNQQSNSSGVFTTADLTPAAANSLFIFCVSNMSSSTPSTFAMVTSNPTWTQRWGIGPLSGGFIRTALATAIRPETTSSGDFSTTANLYNYGIFFCISPAAAAGPSNLKSLDTNLKANIKSYNGNLIANVKSINTNV